MCPSNTAFIATTLLRRSLNLTNDEHKMPWTKVYAVLWFFFLSAESCRVLLPSRLCDQRITDLTTCEIGFACISWLSVSTGGDSPATSHYHQDSPSDFWMIPLIATKSVKIAQTAHLKKTVILFAHAWCSANILMEKPLWVVSSSILYLTWLEFVVARSTKSIWENFTTW